MSARPCYPPAWSSPSLCFYCVLVGHGVRKVRQVLLYGEVRAGCRRKGKRTHESKARDGHVLERHKVVHSVALVSIRLL